MADLLVNVWHFQYGRYAPPTVSVWQLVHTHTYIYTHLSQTMHKVAQTTPPEVMKDSLLNNFTW